MELVFLMQYDAPAREKRLVSHIRGSVQKQKEGICLIFN